MATTTELFLAGAWVDISTYVRQDPGHDITHGVQNEAGTADPATCTLIVNNRDGRFSPRNTAGAYYGNLKRNTPLRTTVGTDVRFVGEVPEWPPRWEQSGNDVWTPLTASGILRRLSRASSLEATLTGAVRYLANLNGNITGYWPIEDAVGATSIASAFPTGTPATFTGAPVFDAVDLSAGTHNVATWGAARATFTPAAATATAFTAGFYLKLPDAGSLTGGEELFRADVAGTARSWRVVYSPTAGGGIFLQVIAGDLVSTELLASSVIGGLDGQAFYVKIEVTNSGANAAWAFGTLGAGFTLTGSIAGQSVGAPTAAYIGAGVLAIPADADVAIGHVILATSNTALFSTTFDQGRSGYAGETVNARMARLATTYGTTIAVTAGPYSPTEMGAQPDGTLLDVLRDAEKADAGGILRDSINSVGLAYITRTARYNDQQPAIALDYAAGHLSPPLEPTDDDQQIRNDVKVNRTNGSSARKALTSGPISTAAYPAGVGPYPFEDTYGVYTDAQLPYLAGWVLGLGTVDETRWPSVTIDLIKNPSLSAAANLIRPGSVLTIANLPAYAGTVSANLQVLGWREHVDSSRREITFICTPASPWRVLELDDTPFGELDVMTLAY